MAYDINGHCGDPKELREKENKAGLRILWAKKRKEKNITMNPTKWFKSLGNL